MPSPLNMSAPLRTKITLATLPCEALKAILTHSYDLDSLLSTIASCRAFYAAFHTSPNALMQALISREIDVDVLPEVIQTLEATTFHSHRLPSSGLPSFIAQLFDKSRETLLNYRWSLDDGIAAIRLHSIVEGFTSEFSSYYLS